jgi:hypothetical protein
MAEFRSYYKYHRHTNTAKPRQTIHNQNRKKSYKALQTNNTQNESDNNLINNLNEDQIDNDSFFPVINDADQYVNCSMLDLSVSPNNLNESANNLIESTNNLNESTNNLNESTISLNESSTDQIYIYSNKRGALNENVVSTALMSLFFGANLTKTALQSTIELIQLLVPDFKIPKTFDQLMLRVLESELKYKKRWFCQECNKYIEIETNGDAKQRLCSDCSHR